MYYVQYNHSSRWVVLFERERNMQVQQLFWKIIHRRRTTSGAGLPARGVKGVKGFKGEVWEEG